MLNKIEFKKIRDFGEIINDTFLFLKQNFKPLLKVFIYLCGFFILASMIIGINQQINLQKITGAPGRFPNFRLLNPLMIVEYFFSFVFGLASFTAMNLSILCFISLYVEKGNIAPTVEEVWAYFKYFFFRAMGSFVVISIFAGLCFVCLILPGIYVFPALSIFFPVMIMENGSLSHSFGRAFKLLKDQWWSTAGTLLIIWIITSACSSIASLPAMALTLFGVFASSSHTLSNTVIIVSSISQSICQVFMIIPIVCVSFIYFNLVERRENVGLMERINHLGETKENFNSNEAY
ncbi:hypothetical protein [Pedobacter sp. L105]|uniref:hypothetical protein n=1 Tax=Pedobacter sp. L105 TaxID=1641871 RepID=UPI00131ABBB3|nr:hypothetical protein [Pedobacter sp. L105]